MGLLILVDTIESSGRIDLLSELTQTRYDAEQTAMNALKLGLENEFTFSCKHAGDNSSTTNIDNASARPPASFITVDPYPFHVITTVRLIVKAITRDYSAQKISSETFKDLMLRLLGVVHALPSCSKQVQDIREHLQLLYKQLVTEPLQF